MNNALPVIRPQKGRTNVKSALYSVGKVLSRLIFLVGLLYILLWILDAALACYSSRAEQAELRQQLNLPTSQKTEVAELYDDHGGFHGDGQSLWQIYPGGESDSTDWTETDTLNTEDWNDLPVFSEDNVNFQFQPYNSDAWYLLNWKARLFEAEDGKWLLVNRGEPAEDGYLLNYTLYFYNSDLGELYCYQFDS